MDKSLSIASQPAQLVATVVQKTSENLPLLPLRLRTNFFPQYWPTKEVLRRILHAGRNTRARKDKRVRAQEDADEGPSPGPSNQGQGASPRISEGPGAIKATVRQAENCSPSNGSAVTPVQSQERSGVDDDSDLEDIAGLELENVEGDGEKGFHCLYYPAIEAGDFGDPSRAEEDGDWHPTNMVIAKVLLEPTDNTLHGYRAPTGYAIVSVEVLSSHEGMSHLDVPFTNIYATAPLEEIAGKLCERVKQGIVRFFWSKDLIYRGVKKSGEWGIAKAPESDYALSLGKELPIGQANRQPAIMKGRYKTRKVG